MNCSVDCCHENIIQEFIDTIDLYLDMLVEIIEGAPINGGPKVLCKILAYPKNNVYLSKSQDIPIGTEIYVDFRNNVYWKMLGRTFAFMHPTNAVLKYDENNNIVISTKKNVLEADVMKKIEC